MTNFPGNPVRVTPTGHADADLIAKAIQLLAFEVRTLALATVGAGDQIGAMGARSEARERLGL